MAGVPCANYIEQTLPPKHPWYVFAWQLLLSSRTSARIGLLAAENNTPEYIRRMLYAPTLFWFNTIRFFAPASSDFVHSPAVSSPPPPPQLAHNVDVRSSLSSRILALNYRLFHDTQAISEWDKFLAQVADEARSEAD